jgi:NDP-sugar pyrophosphorylase family protein
MKAVIQAGGKGTRLRPYTTILPKPLMPVGPKPVLVHLLNWLRRNNVQDVYITTGYLGELIQTICGDGSKWDMRLRYTEETEPLGTVGALSLLRDELDETFLVINGDVLTDLSLNAFSAFHRQQRSKLTIATTRRTTKLDYGVIEDSEGRVTRFKEKPTFSHSVSMGVYCMEPDVLKYIPARVPFGLDNLALCMMEKGAAVCTFAHNGFWLDVGRVEDFQSAQELGWEEQPPAFETISPVSAVP